MIPVWMQCMFVAVVSFGFLVIGLKLDRIAELLAKKHGKDDQ